MSERFVWSGRVRITGRTATGLWVVEFDNLIVNAGLELLAAALTGTDAGIKYMAWGSGTATPVVGDTALGNEIGRKAITGQSNPAGTGNVLTTCYLGPNDANVQIQELGWFGGITATTEADSGELVARVLYAHLKTNLESIQVDRTDTLSQA